MSDSPLNGRTIGLAHYATRAVLERFLAGIGLTFHQEVALNAVGAGEGGVAARAAVVARMTGGLKVDEPTAAGALDGLVAAGLVEERDGGLVALTAAGHEVHRQVRERVQEISAAVYGGLPAEEVAVAVRILTAVTERAEALLAAR